MVLFKNKTARSVPRSSHGSTAKCVSKRVASARMSWSAGPADGVAVLLVHGNCSSAPFWGCRCWRHLPGNLRIIAPDLRGYGQSETAPVDATRGLSDFADDVAALLDDKELFPSPGKVIVRGALDGLRGRHAAADRPSGPGRRAAARSAGESVRLRRDPGDDDGTPTPRPTTPAPAAGRPTRISCSGSPTRTAATIRRPAR